MKQLPVGIKDFKVIRNDGNYYVDKSMLIGEILSKSDKTISLYTRPRRFGKSLNLSMLDAFFNVEYKGNTWFDGLEISKHPEYNCYKNAYPVISISLKLGNPRDFNDFINMFNSGLFRIFKKFTYLKDSPKIDEETKKIFNKYYTGEKTLADSRDALNVLCSMLEDHHNSKVIVLIDEYDGTVNNITNQELRREVVSFLGDMLSLLLKDNDSLQMGIVTGIMQITKENIFSGTNNLSVNHILSKKYDEMFGFTDEDVKQICIDYGHPEKFEEAKEWYDGYRFGDTDIYNPWSILKYVDEDFEAGTYWANTSSNDLIYELILKANKELSDDLRILGSGGTIVRDISTALTFDDLKDSKNVYSLMAVSGYLKAIPKGRKYDLSTPEGRKCILSIPNRELFFVFSNLINRATFTDGGDESKLTDFTVAVTSNDIDAMKESLYKLITAISSRVLDNEHSYQAFITGLLMSLCGNYDVKADFENGRGYSDIMMTKKKGIGPNVVIELKRSENDRCLEHDAQAALQQIKDKDYAHGLEGKTILYGVAFSGKQPFIISEEI